MEHFRPFRVLRPLMTMNWFITERDVDVLSNESETQ